MQSIESTQNNHFEIECKICNAKFKSKISVSKRIKVHGLSGKEYYDKFNKLELEGICYCGKPAKYINSSIVN